MIALLLIFIVCAPAVLTQDPRGTAEHYCYVKSPTDSSVFNLTTIQHELNDSTIRINEDEHLRVHFCRPLRDPCNGKHNYAVCLHVNGTEEIGVGKEPPQVGIEFGKIMFRYTGDKCNESHYYTVIIEMSCNFSMKEKVAVDLDIIYTRDQCSFQMAVQTSAACAKRKQTTCELDNKSGYYNLSPLMNLANNYKLKINGSLSVILNVCHSLIYGEHFHQCNHDTMVCLIDTTDETEEKSYKRLGNINSDVSISTINKTVYLDLTSDTPCHEEDANGLKTIRTTIEFVCNEYAYNKLPKYRSGFGTCHYKFRWQTIVACSEAILIRHSELNRKPCQITDPIYSHIYDMSMLEGKAFYSHSADMNAEYKFSICSPLKSSNCTRPGTSVCKYIKDKKLGVSEGLSNTHLFWRRGRIFLNYTDGAACGNNRRKYTTISFYCEENDSLIINDEDPCVTSIAWSTVMVCNRRCATSDYKINLDKLGRHSSNYVAQGETNFTEYHLNVCEPLVDEHYTNCTDGAGICKVINDEEGNRISDINLGFATSGLRRDNDGRVYLSYLNGSVCDEDNSKRISTDITFLCDVEVSAVGHIFFGLGESFLLSQAFQNFLKIYQGKPNFKNYSNCKYDFDWKTGFSCDKFDEVLSRDCSLTNKVEIFNLSTLVQKSIFKLNKGEPSGYFNVTICEKMNKCNGSLVCDDDKFYERDLKTLTSYAQNLVAFKFRNETKCKNNVYYKSVMKVWCDVWAGLAESFLLKEGECNVGLEWAKNAVCKPKEKIKAEEKENSAKKSASFLPVLQIIFAITLVAILVTLCYYFRYGYRRTLYINILRFYVNKYILCRRGPEPTEDLSL